MKVCCFFFEKFLNENSVGFSRKSKARFENEKVLLLSLSFFGLSCEMIGDGEQKDPLKMSCKMYSVAWQNIHSIQYIKSGLFMLWITPLKPPTSCTETL